MTAIEWGLLGTLAGVLTTISVWIISDRRANRFQARVGTFQDRVDTFQHSVLLREMEEQEKKDMMLMMLEAIRQQLVEGRQR